MADEGDEQSWRPILLASAALAVVGWLAAGFVWWQGSRAQSNLTEQLAAADRARESLAADLQNLEKTAGAAAELKKQAADAEKALADASTARASAQNELADLTRQISDARLVISGAQEEASAKTRDLQAVDSRLKDENDRVAALQSQDQTLSGEQPVCRAMSMLRARLSPMLRRRRRPRRSSLRPCKARSTPRPLSSTPFKRKFAQRSPRRARAQIRDSQSGP